MAGTVTLAARRKVDIGKDAIQRYYEICQADILGDASTGSFPDTEITLTGYLTKIIWVPGSTAPDAGLSLTLTDPLSASLDVLGGAGASLGTSPKQFVPILADSPAPLILGGIYTIKLTGNSTVSANGKFQFWMSE